MRDLRAESNPSLTLNEIALVVSILIHSVYLCVVCAYGDTFQTPSPSQLCCLHIMPQQYSMRIMASVSISRFELHTIYTTGIY